MPVSRTARQRLVENDENSTTRTTRAKAAAGAADDAKPLQTRKAGVNANTQAGQRKRAALGDVSNVGKTEVVEGKKPAGRAGLASKAAQPTGIQKASSRTTTTTRAALATKKAEAKRAGSGSGSLAGVQKRKVAASSSVSVKEEASGSENEPLRKKVHTEEPEKRGRAPHSSAKAAAPTIEEPEPRAIDLTEERELPEGVQELEMDDGADPFMVAEYSHEIFDYLRDLEVNSMPNPNYMDDQDDVEWKMRGILVDWLVEVHHRFHLLPETLFLAINIVDRFLSEKVVRLDRLQLVGITALFIASKYEEVLSPHVSNFQRVTDDGYDENEILEAERFILGALNYDLSYPNPMNFLRRVSKADNYDFQSRSIGKYLTEVSLLDHRFMSYRPSHVAAAAMYLSRLVLDRGDWDDVLTFYAGYTQEELEPVVELMVDYLARPPSHEAFFKKYAHKKFLKASIVCRSWAKKHAQYFGVENPEVRLEDLPESR